MLEKIKKTREYLDYLEEHYNNVQKAWELVKEKCKDMRFIQDDFCYHTLESEIKYHDESKLSRYEFVQYRRKFYPTEEESESYKKEIEKGYQLAWGHHKCMNDHHWNKWIHDPPQPYPEIAVVHNIVDWIAMGIRLGDTAEDYYKRSKYKMNMPEWADKLMREIFDRIYHS